MRNICSYSFALEDAFFLYLNGFEPGFFVDIGCGHPIIGSNSKLLECAGWRGICIDATKHREWDEYRSTKCVTVDATSADYRALFNAGQAPSLIEALSIDVDDACYQALETIPFADFRFKSIIIEHDVYRTQALREREREFLTASGYELVCADVFHEPGKPFEDWWLRSEYFESELVAKLRCQGRRDIDIIRRFGQNNSIVRLNGFDGLYPQIEVA